MALGRAAALVALSVCTLPWAPVSSATANPGPNSFPSKPGEGSPAWLQEAYDLTALSESGGHGVTVAILEIEADPTVESDLEEYRENYNLPPCTSASGCFRYVAVGGGPVTNAGSEPEGETSLDVDAVSAICPNCSILVVVGGSIQAMSASAATALSLGAKIISASFALQHENVYETFNFPGVATVASSGDRGYLEQPSPGYFAAPGVLPNTTAAGGTALLTPDRIGTPSLRGFSEVVWHEPESASGSTCDPYIAKPPWQTESPGCSGRSTADLSAQAAGMWVRSGGHWVWSSGTSESAPLIAGYYAITGAPAENPSWAYGSAAALNDITVGANSVVQNCPADALYLCNAGPGYDGPTGVGSISGSAVRGAPGIGGPSMVNKTYTQSATYDSTSDTVAASLQAGVYTNGLPTSYWWQYGINFPDEETAHLELPGSCAISSVTGSLVGLQAAKNYVYRLVAQNSLGPTYGYTVSLDTEPSKLPSTEPSLASSGPPTACPTPRLFPDAPNPTRPSSATKTSSPSHHHGHVSALHITRKSLSFKYHCPPQATPVCLVKSMVRPARAAHPRQIKTSHVHAGAAVTIRFRLRVKLRGTKRLQLKVSAREPPGPFFVVLNKVLRRAAGKRQSRH